VSGCAACHATRLFVSPTDTDTDAAARSTVAADVFRAMTRTVLYDHTRASTSMNRVKNINYATATATFLRPTGGAA
jgi:hypothetical protein